MLPLNHGSPEVKIAATAHADYPHLPPPFARPRVPPLTGITGGILFYLAVGLAKWWTTQDQGRNPAGGNYEKFEAGSFAHPSAK